MKQMHTVRRPYAEIPVCILFEFEIRGNRQLPISTFDEDKYINILCAEEGAGGHICLEGLQIFDKLLLLVRILALM